MNTRVLHLQTRTPPYVLGIPDITWIPGPLSYLHCLSIQRNFVCDILHRVLQSYQPAVSCENRVAQVDHWLVRVLDYSACYRVSTLESEGYQTICDSLGCWVIGASFQAIYIRFIAGIISIRKTAKHT